MKQDKATRCHEEIETGIRKSIRHFMCYQHEGGKAFLELFEALKSVSLDRESICKILDDELSRPPGYKDPSQLGIDFAVKLMRFQHIVDNLIEKVEVTSTDTPNGSRAWEVKVQMADKDFTKNQGNDGTQPVSEMASEKAGTASTSKGNATS